MSHKHRDPLYPLGYKEVFDTHAHLYDARIFQDAENVLNRALECGVDPVLVPADNEETSRLAADYVQKWDGFNGIDLYCSVGVHPHEASSYTDDTEAFLTDMLSKRDAYKIKAIGEIGLDLYWDKTYYEQQREVLKRQILWARELGLPVCLHVRKAYNELFGLLRDLNFGTFSGVMHCFGGSVQEAHRAVEMGFHIGIGGVVTFKNATLAAVAAAVPLERILLETDAPYLAPVPYRGKRNESAYIPIIAAKIADLKEISLAEVAAVTTASAQALFHL